ncbi:MAG: thioesterase family protein [Pseudazoarcus pumilus]|nr:thioesterase family protein [Pseudazoarcus pumilus]
MTDHAANLSPLDDFPAELLLTAKGHVLDEWLDHNGHMNVAYYLLVFDRATDCFHALLGKNADYTRRTGCSTFALEMHLTYERELLPRAPYAVRTQLVDHDHKRIHMLHRMFHAEEGWLAATNESISMHIDMGARRSTPFPPEITTRLERLAAAHADLPDDGHIGRRVGIRRKST